MGIDINNPFAQSLLSEGQARGYTPYDISAAIGNAYAESGLRTDGPSGDKGTAFGGMQWRMDRFDKLKAKAAQMGLNWTDPKVQATHWYDEQDAAGLKGASDIATANRNVISSLRPAGYTRNGPIEAAHNFDGRLGGTTQAYSALSGRTAPGALTPEPGILAAGGAPNPADLPAPMAQEAQGVMAQQGYQPTLTDSLDKLSAAFFMRDNPQAAQTINNSLRDKMTNQVQSLRRAQMASERWQMGKPYRTSDGQYGATQINPQTGESRFVPMAPPKEEEKPISRPEEAAVSKVNTARAALGQLDVVSNHIDTLREALALGNFDVGPDRTGAMVIRNLTGNSTENDRKLKAMESSIIGAATAIAQTQKGALTNFKFAKDMEMVMPSFSANDKKAAYESITRVAEGINEAYNATVETIRSGAKAAPKYAGKMLKPDGDGAGEEVDTIEFFSNKAKERAEREKRIRTLVPAFMASPGRGQSAAPAAPAVGFVKNGWRFKGGNPADQSNWTKEN